MNEPNLRFLMSGESHNRLGFRDFWEIYAMAKYGGRDLHGARDLLHPPATVEAMAELLIDLCECCWRSGIRLSLLSETARRILRERR